MGKPKTPERRKPGNAELRSAMGAIELWIRHAAVKNSGVIKVTHHELVTIHDALVLALREDNPQSLLVLDTDAGTEVRKEIVEEAPKKKRRKPKKAAKTDKKDEPVAEEPTVTPVGSELENAVLSELEPEIELDLDFELETDIPVIDTGDEDKT